MMALLLVAAACCSPLRFAVVFSTHVAAITAGYYSAQLVVLLVTR